MTKSYLARYIAGTLFNMEGLAPADNWKVKNLLKRRKAELLHLYNLAVDARITRELENR